MVSLNILVISAMLGLTAAEYRCATNLRRFGITVAQADAAVVAGGDSKGLSGYPHAFHNSEKGGGVAVKFYGADKQCNKAYPKDGSSPLLEYPVFSTGRVWDKNQKGELIATPARVVYIKEGLRLCGVMTHVTERPDHTGEGFFKGCDWAENAEHEL